MKVCPINTRLKEIHEAYSDNLGYLNLITKNEATF